MPLMIGCPNVSGAGLGLGAAKLTIASKTPTEQRVKATKARGLNKPDCEEGFFFMRFSFVSLQLRLSLTVRKLRPDWMLFFQITQNQPPKSSRRRGIRACRRRNTAAAGEFKYSGSTRASPRRTSCSSFNHGLHGFETRSFPISLVAHSRDFTFLSEIRAIRAIRG